ncbi:hypothetical protein Efla_001712 [Eimeria flavescens]
MTDCSGRLFSSQLVHNLSSGALPSTALPTLHNGNPASISDNADRATEQTTAAAVIEPMGSNRAKPADFVVQGDNRASNESSHKNLNDNMISQHQCKFSEKASYSDIDKNSIAQLVRFGLEASGACHIDNETPIVSYEHPCYWVVQKPLLRHKATTAKGILSTSESLTSFLREVYPESKFPILWSRDHNFGVVIILEDSWLGLTVVAKSEEAYNGFEAILELQLFHCYVECFVSGPLLHANSKLYGRTAIGQAPLCVEVLRSTVCRTGCGRTPDYTEANGGQSLADSSFTVVSNVVLRINFPPILLADILWCNKLIITPDPYASSAPKTPHQDYIAELCCFGISFPFGRVPDDGIGSQQQYPEMSQDKEDHPPKIHSYVKKCEALGLTGTASRPLANRWPTVYAGLVAASPLLYTIFLKVTKWALKNISEAHLGEQTWTFFNKCLKKVAKGGIFDTSNLFFHLSVLGNRFTTASPSFEVEILFGRREGAPWLHLHE